MRISDWSSDVCSSDLLVEAAELGLRLPMAHLAHHAVKALLDGIPHRLQRHEGGANQPCRPARPHRQPAQTLHLRPGGGGCCCPAQRQRNGRSEEHTSELQSLMRISYAVFCLKKKKSQRTIKN